LYGFHAYGEEVLKTPGPVLLLSNHVSWFDWLFLGVCLDTDWRFVVSGEAAEISWAHRKIMVNHRTFRVDMNSPYAIKHMADYLHKGGRLVLFPEGRLTKTGSLMKLFDGTGFLIDKTRAKVVTAFLRGAARMPGSRNPNRKQWFPLVSAHFSQVLHPPPESNSSASEARAHVTEWLREKMMEQQFQTEMEFGPRTIPAAIQAAALDQPKKVVLQDVSMKTLTYQRLLLGASLLENPLRGRLSESETRVGVLLPNANAFSVLLLSLWGCGKVPAILNYTVGPAALLACVKLASLQHIITSREFLERAKLDVQPIKQAGVELIFMEDLRATITRGQKFQAALQSRFGNPHNFDDLDPEATAVVLFTSGSEGQPKGVELTHKNILSNIRQMLSVIDLLESDRFFNALPLFHSFGLTIGLLLPMVRSVFVFLYVSPLHYRVIPAAFYNTDCTIFFGTNTFLSGYARKAHPYDFRSLRYLFAGAEKLQKNTMAVWTEKFGARIIEGYGATECSPCVSANTPMDPRSGSVGRFLPNIEYRLDPVPGVADPDAAEPEPPGAPHRPPAQTGRLLVRGPNIMKGYLNPDANAKFQELGGWYDTGDVVKVDSDGFLFILGRLKRFAKISGEMVSLTAVEESLASAFPSFGIKFAIAVVAQPDEDRGEKLVAITNETKLTLADIRTAVRAHGLPNIAVPGEIKTLPDLPRLATGKIDYRALQTLGQVLK
jgi:acyl-[acyl-carrier-protein]-phospholipid O-acyltransferase/long-chain-fatty-acid--[acyl-carrier-protein] ligase